MEPQTKDCQPENSFNSRQLLSTLLRLRISNITVYYFPKNATSICQLMDRGAIALFKESYRNLLSERIVNRLAQDEDSSVIKILKDFNISDAIRLAVQSWNNMPGKLFPHFWRKAGLAYVQQDTYKELIFDIQIDEFDDIENNFQIVSDKLYVSITDFIISTSQRCEEDDGNFSKEITVPMILEAVSTLKTAAIQQEIQCDDEINSLEDLMRWKMHKKKSNQVRSLF